MVSLASLKVTCGKRCAHCGRLIKFSESICTDEDSATRDHVIPKSLGGSNESNNLVLLCRACNTSRKSNTVDIFTFYSFLPVGKFVNLATYLHNEGFFEEYANGYKWTSAKQVQDRFRPLHDFAVWSLSQDGIDFIKKFAFCVTMMQKIFEDASKKLGYRINSISSYVCDKNVLGFAVDVDFFDVEKSGMIFHIKFNSTEPLISISGHRG